MNKLKQDRYIKSIFKTDNYINSKIDENINKFIEEKEKTITNKSIKIYSNSFLILATTASVVLVLFIGINIKAKMKGKPNAITAIQALFSKEIEQQELEQEKEVKEEEQEKLQINESNEQTNISQNNTTNTNVSNTNNDYEKVKQISSWEAEQLILKKYGNVDVTTQIRVEYKYNGITKLDDNKDYYSFDMNWTYPLSEFGSYLTTIYVSTDGTKIKERYNNPNATKQSPIVETNEDTNIPVTIPKERTELVSGIIVTFPNVEVSKITIADGTQIASNIHYSTGKGIAIYKPEFCNEYYGFKSFERIESYIKDNTDVEIEQLNINGQKWLAYREKIDGNVTCINMYTIKNENNYEVTAYYSTDTENQAFKIINTIKIP